MFKVGDKVKIHKGKSSASHRYNDQYSVVTRVFDFDAVNLEIEDDYGGGFWFHELTLVESKLKLRRKIK